MARSSLRRSDLIALGALVLSTLSFIINYYIARGVASYQVRVQLEQQEKREQKRVVDSLISSLKKMRDLAIAAKEILSQQGRQIPKDEKSQAFYDFIGEIDEFVRRHGAIEDMYRDLRRAYESGVYNQLEPSSRAALDTIRSYREMKAKPESPLSLVIIQLVEKANLIDQLEGQRRKAFDVKE